MTPVPTRHTSQGGTWRNVHVYGQVLLAVILSALFLKIFALDAIYVPSPSMEKTILPGDYVFVNKLIYGSRIASPFSHSGFPAFHLPGLQKLSRGDVIVFEFPAALGGQESGQTLFVKRLAGLPGDTLSISAGNLCINGVPAVQANPGQLLLAGVHPTKIAVPKSGDVVELTPGSLPFWTPIIEHEGHRITVVENGAIMIDDRPTNRFCVAQNYLFVLGDNETQSYDSRSWGFLPEENVTGNAMMIYWSVSPRSSSAQAGGFWSSIRWDRIGRFVR